MTVAFCHRGARGKVPTYPFSLFAFSRMGAKCLSVCPSVQGPTGGNLLSILDCKPVLERSPNYLEVLFLFCRNFYFLRT